MKEEEGECKLPYEIEFVVGDKIYPLTEGEILTDERVIDRKRGLIRDIVIFRAEDGFTVNLTFCAMKSKVVPQLFSLEIQAETFRESGEVSLRFRPVICLEKAGYSIHNASIQEIEQGRVAALLEVERETGAGYAGISVTLDQKPWPLSEIQELWPAVVPMKRGAEGASADLQFLYTVVENPDMEWAGKRAGDILATILMLPLPYWYQQQELYLEQSRGQ